MAKRDDQNDDETVSDDELADGLSEVAGETVVLSSDGAAPVPSSGAEVPADPPGEGTTDDSVVLAPENPLVVEAPTDPPDEFGERAEDPWGETRHVNDPVGVVCP